MALFAAAEARLQPQGPSEYGAVLDASVMAALALAALAGLWKRRLWGRILFGVQCLLLLYRSVDDALAKAVLAYAGATDHSASAAMPHSLEALSRDLPRLVPLLAATAILIATRTPAD
jgi:hypothetical protein